MITTVTSGPVGGPELQGELSSDDPRRLILGLGLFPTNDLQQLDGISSERRAWLLGEREACLLPASDFSVVRRVGPERDVEAIDPGQYVVVALPKLEAEA